jgi:hypothetical protein
MSKQRKNADEKHSSLEHNIVKLTKNVLLV